MNLEWWREEWMRFLESERSGARTTTSGWFTVLIALVGLFLTTMATLSSQRASNILDCCLTLRIFVGASNGLRRSLCLGSIFRSRQILYQALPEPVSSALS